MFFLRRGRGRKHMNEYRRTAAAGLFYPADPGKLNAMISAILDVAVNNKEYENIHGLVSPHAGYIYSGKTAGYAFNQVRNKNYSTVIIISPSHREYFSGISIYPGKGYNTPLGNVDIDQEIADKLCEGSKFIFRGIEGHREEHAVEVQIPFLQSALIDFKIVPVVMGDQSPSLVNELAEKISSVYRKDILVIASSDLSHYHSKKIADNLDSIIDRRIMEYDYERLLEDLEEGRCEACGGGPIVALMKSFSTTPGIKADVLNRSDSGDTTGDNSQVVGYLSAAVYN
jgi:AmmeMemoRadiSam system protein B